MIVVEGYCCRNFAKGPLEADLAAFSSGSVTTTYSKGKERLDGDMNVVHKEQRFRVMSWSRSNLLVMERYDM